jgi:pyruvate/2-oxoglutarate dehydrogenase complex dihydrolipoamide dehydrogenase (E3) component
LLSDEELARRAIPVDEGLHTAVQGVWAIGDVNGNAPFTNVSYHDFQVLYESWTNGKDLSTAGRNHVHAEFVDPPVARVGLNEREAKEREVEYRAATTQMAHVARAIEMGETAGLVKVLVDPSSHKLLGASMMGVHADEVIHVFAALLDAGAPYEVLEQGVYVHPTVAEALPVLVRQIEGGYA